jgi:hypothetical protein
LPLWILHSLRATAAAPGSYATPLLPLLKDKLLPAFGAGWQAGVAGAPGGCVPSDGEYAAALAGASSLLFLGPGRLLAHVPPAVRPGWGASADESSCVEGLTQRLKLVTSLAALVGGAPRLTS